MVWFCMLKDRKPGTVFAHHYIEMLHPKAAAARECLNGGSMISTTFLPVVLRLSLISCDHFLCSCFSFGFPFESGFERDIHVLKLEH